MKGLPESSGVSKFTIGSSTDSSNRDPNFGSLDQKTGNTKPSKTSTWSSFFPSFSIFEAHHKSSSFGKKESISGMHGWTTALRRAVTIVSMRRIQERLLGFNKTGVSSSNSEKWLLGVCYKVLSEECSDAAIPENGFLEDFSSRIWITYRKGFDAIDNSKYTSDVNWGCMLRSSQMLVAQALLFHHLGRSWRKPMDKPSDPYYIEILHLFGDSEKSAFSLHNLLQAGKSYGLAAGSWVGPYAMCRSWETLANAEMEKTNFLEGNQPLPMAVYIVSGDEDGERGGAPVVYIEHAARLCSEFCKREATWAPLLLLVPLVLGLDKINPRYIPQLWATFTFPQSLGIMGGKPGASTYIVGVQDDIAFYLDPHEVQQVVDIRRHNLEVDTSSYHCSVVRSVALEAVDPSLAIGFYCRDRDDFEDFYMRASELADQSNGAPLFTVARSLSQPKHGHQQKDATSLYHQQGDSLDKATASNFEARPDDDDWQIL